METIRLGSTGDSVTKLQELLNKWGYATPINGIFDDDTNSAVCQMQDDRSLTVDGVVGSKTWTILQDDFELTLHSLRIKEQDYVDVANFLDVDVAAVKAVKSVETGFSRGFVDVEKPVILFEGHIFWQQLEKNGLTPGDYVNGNEDILYSKWSRGHYVGGKGEYDRLNRAISIHRVAALASASWGLFQIMGFNYASCGCSGVEDFVGKMQKDEGTQLNIFAQFIKSNSLDKHLRDLNWSEFARRYNGPSYAQNKYDTKLHDAYERYKK
ncbi:MAG: N-acetylmuramidase family protein [Rikenellaceae bacterium]